MTTTKKKSNKKYLTYKIKLREARKQYTSISKIDAVFDLKQNNEQRDKKSDERHDTQSID